MAAKKKMMKPKGKAKKAAAIPDEMAKGKGGKMAMMKRLAGKPL